MSAKMRPKGIITYRLEKELLTCHSTDKMLVIS